QHDLGSEAMQQLDAWFDRFPQLNRAHALKEGFLSIWDARNRADAEARFKVWLGHIDTELSEAFKELTTAMRNWYEEVFAYFDNRITNAYTESANSLTRLMHRMGRGYSFEVLRARMLYDERARQATRRILETAARRDDDAGMAYFTRATTRSRVLERRVIEYGPSIEVLVRQLEAGDFE
uniref:transposase n=1 Tax=Metallibacterium scheffleri TaxID=993689 RepID=UPI0023F1E462